jgi:hypothetical protein
MFASGIYLIKATIGVRNKKDYNDTQIKRWFLRGGALSFIGMVLSYKAFMLNQR